MRRGRLRPPRKGPGPSKGRVSSKGDRCWATEACVLGPVPKGAQEPGKGTTPTPKWYGDPPHWPLAPACRPRALPCTLAAPRPPALGVHSAA